MALPASLPGEKRGKSMKAEAFVCIPHVKDKGTAVDVEILPLVMCKDCKHWDSDEHVCNIKIGWFSCGADWFCADGERKEPGE